MQSTMSIGDFARATQLTVKTLRFYHETGLLVPVEVDENSGYRRYAIDQIPTAQVIRRFRELDMPLEEIERVVTTPDVASRNALIAAHLQRLRDEARQTQERIASLEFLLEGPRPDAAIEHRTADKTLAAAITEVIETSSAEAWYHGALGELFGTLAVQKIPQAGVAGGIFSTELFTQGRGTATVYLPCDREVQQIGRVASITVPAAELAVTTHRGGHGGIDAAYGALGSHVTRRAIGVDGPVREFYLVSSHETPVSEDWVTEVGWPIFSTG